MFKKKAELLRDDISQSSGSPGEGEGHPGESHEGNFLGSGIGSWGTCKSSMFICMVVTWNSKIVNIHLMDT